jgi:hypothetical protein
VAGGTTLGVDGVCGAGGPREPRTLACGTRLDVTATRRKWAVRPTPGTLVGPSGPCRQNPAAHGEAGWHAHTFPLSVDGIEIVASLVLLADRRTGRRSGWLPWAALAAGTTPSVAANVAAAGTDLIGRVIAGWPAFALLIAKRLLSGPLEGRDDADRPTADDRPAAVPILPGLRQTPGTPGTRRARPVPQPAPRWLPEKVGP